MAIWRCARVFTVQVFTLSLVLISGTFFADEEQLVGYPVAAATSNAQGYLSLHKYGTFIIHVFAVCLTTRP